MPFYTFFSILQNVWNTKRENRDQSSRKIEHENAFKSVRWVYSIVLFNKFKFVQIALDWVETRDHAPTLVVRGSIGLFSKLEKVVYARKKSKLKYILLPFLWQIQPIFRKRERKLIVAEKAASLKLVSKKL